MNNEMVNSKEDLELSFSESAYSKIPLGKHKATFISYQIDNERNVVVLTFNIDDYDVKLNLRRRKNLNKKSAFNNSVEAFGAYTPKCKLSDLLEEQVMADIQKDENNYLVIREIHPVE